MIDDIIFSSIMINMVSE